MFRALPYRGGPATTDGAPKGAVAFVSLPTSSFVRRFATSLRRIGSW